MKVLNKYETVGIFLSIAVMAVSLSMLRTHSQTFVSKVEKTKNEGSVIVANTEKKNSDNSELENTLKDASTIDGELVKLVVKDVRLGTGATVKKGDTVVVQYIGTTRDGVKFDSSYDRGEPFIFTVGKGVVIKGWDEGILGMKVGGQRILVIPSDMAYGNRQVGTIPSNTPLVFAVELLEIR